MSTTSQAAHPAPEPLWEFTDEHAWLLRSAELLFEQCVRPGNVYGCKGCGIALPAKEHSRHLEHHRRQLGGEKRSARQTAPHGVTRIAVGLDDLPEYRRPVVERIISMRRDKLGYTEIAKALNREDVPSFGGGKGWYAVTVRAQFLKYTQEAGT